MDGHDEAVCLKIAGANCRLCCQIGNQIMPGPGSGGNVIAALSSFFIPGLGQLLQGRVLMALIQFVLAGVMWILWLGWLVHLWSVIDAARFNPGT